MHVLLLPFFSLFVTRFLFLFLIFNFCFLALHWLSNKTTKYTHTQVGRHINGYISFIFSRCICFIPCCQAGRQAGEGEGERGRRVFKKLLNCCHKLSTTTTKLKFKWISALTTVTAISWSPRSANSNGQFDIQSGKPITIKFQQTL